MAVQDYELLLRVRADLMEAINGLKGLTDQLGGADAATRKLGESENQATDRIRTMVQASLDQQRAVQQSATATRDAAVQSERIVAAYDQQATAAARAAAANADYNRSFGQAGGGGRAAAANTAALVAQREEMAKLAGQIDPTINALRRLDDQEKSLNAMRKAGVVGMEDYARFKAVIDANRLAITGAGKAMHTFSLNTAQTRLEMGRLIKDISTGQWGRLASTGTTLANQAGFISALFSPVGLAIGAVVGSLGAFALAANQAASAQNAFNKALAETGGYAGTTASGLERLATQIAGSNARMGDARDVLTQLVASGKVGERALGSMGQAALDMAQLTGESADKAAAAVLHMFDGTTESVLKANDQYHFLTSAIYDQIKALQDEGDTQAAMDVAAQAFHDAAMQRIADEKEQVRGLAALWDKLRDAFKSGWEEFRRGASLTFGTATDQVRLENLQQRKLFAQRGIATGSLVDMFYGTANTSWTSADEKELEQLQAKIKRDTQKAELAGFTDKLNDGAVKADAALDRLGQSLDKNAAKQAALNKLNADFLALWNGEDPAHPNPRLKGVQAITGEDGKTTFAGGLYDQLRAGIEKRYAEKSPRPKREKSDAAAVAAQQQLIKLLNDEQGALDPTAKAWAEYNNKVAEANRLAEKAKTARGADKQAIDAERDALIANAAAVRDAAIEKQVDADRKAWEKLRDSLRTPVEVATDKAVEKLVELNKLMQRLKGTKDEISDAQYADAVKRIADQSVTPAPKYKGLDASVGGVGSELRKNFQALADLDKWHQEQLAANEAFRAKDTANEEAYQERLKAINDKYAEQRSAIEQDRGQLVLQTAASLFGQLAQLSRSHNTKMAIIGKSAAIAEAIISTYTAATNAYKAMSGIPYVGPALGAAAAGVAIATGLANVAQIRAQPVGGYAEGGYTGAGGKFEVAGVVHKGEGVLSQQDIAALGGPDGFYALQHQLRNGYADGGIAWPTPELPPVESLSDVIATADAAARNRPSADSAGAPGQTHIHVWSMEQAAEELAKQPAFQDAVVHVVGDNPRTIQGKWGR